MKKISLLLCVLCLAFHAPAQIYDNDVDTAFSTLLKTYSTRDSFEAFEMRNYERLHDSIGLALVKRYIEREVIAKHGPYNWPSRVIEGYPDPTYQYLLKEQYKVTWPVSSGCVDQRSFRCYDSLMAIVLKERYGPDFFERSRREAHRLDLKGQGLTLPELKNKKRFFDTIRKIIRELDSTLVQNDHPPVTEIILVFKDRKLEDACAGERSFGGLQCMPFTYFAYTEQLAQLIKKWSWSGPQFKGAPATCAVVADLQAEKLYINPSW